MKSIKTSNLNVTDLTNEEECSIFGGDEPGYFFGYWLIGVWIHASKTQYEKSLDSPISGPGGYKYT